MPEPTRAREFMNEAIDAGLAVAWVPGKDTGNNPYVTVSVITELGKAHLTWHTRDTGSYRLFSATVGEGRLCRDITLKRARELLTPSGD